MERVGDIVVKTKRVVRESKERVRAREESEVEL